MPGGRLKLARQDFYALGTHRGGIDERWFASTTAAANEGAPPDEGLSYVVHDGEHASRSRTPSPLHGPELIGDDDLEEVQELAGLQQVLRQHGPDPPPHAPERRAGRARRPEGKPESYYFPPQLNAIGNNFPYTFFGPGAGHDQGRHPPLPGALERGRQRHPRPLARPTASSPAPAGWSRPCVLHAPGSLVTYEPQWGSDVFGMYQSMVEGRRVPWELLVKDMPEDKHQRPRLPRRAARLGEATSIPHFKDSHYLEPIVRAGGDGRGLRRPVDRLRQGRRRAALHAPRS